MSVSHLNYTGRKRIARTSVLVGVGGELPDASVVASFDLQPYDFPGTARVVIEAQAGWTIQRFDFGTVQEYRAPSDSRLSEFASLAGLLFRLKVVATGDQEGRLLGAADRLRPSGATEEAAQRSFVVVRPEDLGDRIWQLDFDEHQPLLLVNSGMGDHHEFLRRRSVAALVLPEVFSQLLRHAVEYGSEEEELDNWRSMAIRMGEHMAARSLPQVDDPEAIADWVDDCVRVFCRRHRFLEAMAEWVEGAE